MIIKISQFGKILVSRPAGREAVLAFQAYGGADPKQQPILELDFDGILSLAPSWLDEFVTGLKAQGFEIHYLPTTNLSVRESIKILEEPPEE